MKTNTIIITVVAVILVIIIALTAYFITTEKAGEPKKGDKIIITQYEFPEGKATVVKEIELTDKTKILEFEKAFEGLVPPEKEDRPPAILDEVIIEFGDGTRVYVELSRNNYCFSAKKVGEDEQRKTCIRRYNTINSNY